MNHVRQRMGHNAATLVDSTQIQEPVGILGGWRSATFPNVNSDLPRYMRPTASAMARTRSEGMDRFVFNTETGDLGVRTGANRPSTLRSRRTSIGSARGSGFATRSGVRLYAPKVAASQRAKSMDNDSVRVKFWDSVLVEVHRQHALTVREPGSLSPMRTKASGVESASAEMEECASDQPSCQTPEMLPENKHHKKLDELIARCANLTCYDGPTQATGESNDVAMPSSPSSSEASVTSRLKNKECWMEGGFEEGALGNCDPMPCIDFTGAPQVTTGIQ